MKVYVFSIIAMAFFTGCGKSTPEKEFWQWFQQNEDRMFNLKAGQYQLLDELGNELAKVHPDITFELSSNDGGKREFIISANGNKKAFPSVESLHSAAPQNPRWIFIKFRQRKGIDSGLKFKGKVFNPDEFEVTLEPDGNKIGLTVYAKGLTADNKDIYIHAGYLMLDMAIGEYDMETKVGLIEFKAFSEISQYKRIAFKELPEQFDKFVVK